MIESHPSLHSSSGSGQLHVTIHHFQETIDGHPYHIDVVSVSNRWRAQLRRGPGIPRAMMPFYGKSPDEAAQLLFRWLVIAHRPARTPETPPA